MTRKRAATIALALMIGLMIAPAAHGLQVVDIVDVAGDDGDCDDDGNDQDHDDEEDTDGDGTCDANDPDDDNDGAPDDCDPHPERESMVWDVYDYAYCTTTSTAVQTPG